MTRLERFVRAADLVAFGLLGIALAIDILGGVQIGRGWYRVSMRDPRDPAIAAAVILAVRHLIRFRPSIRARIRSGFTRLPLSHLGASRVSGKTMLIAAVIMLAATALLLHDQLRQLDGVPDRGDPLFSMWRLGWIAHQLRADPAHLFDANIFHPARNTLAYSDATLLPALIAAPAIWMGAPVAVVHGVLYMFSFASAGVAMFALAHAVTRRMVPSLGAGVIFAFYPYRLSTYSHLEMQGIALMPLALLFLMRLLTGGRTRDGVWLGILLGSQTLWSFYLGAYLAVGLFAFAAVFWFVGQFSVRERAGGLILAAVLCLAIVIPYAVPYWRAERAVGSRAVSDLAQFTARPADFVTVTTNTALYGSRLTTTTNAERALFPGIVPIGLAIVAVIPPITPIAAAGATASLVATDAARGLDAVVFNVLYTLAPPFRAFRVPARFGMVLGLFLCLLTAIGLSRIDDLTARHRAVVIAPIAILAIAIGEVRPHLELQPAPPVPAIYRLLADDPRAPVIDLPLPEDDSEFLAEPTYVYYSTSHWHPLLNGYSGFSPEWYSQLQVASRELPSNEALATFQRAGARYLVTHQSYYPPERYRVLVAGFAERADLHLVAVESSPEGERRLYALAAR